MFFAVDTGVQRDRRSLINWVHWIAAIVILVATQSKSPMVGTVVALAAIALMASKGMTRALTASALGLAGTLLVALWFFVLPNTGAAGFQETASTLTSRTGIWEFAFNQWKENPFGYGSAFFEGGSPMSEKFFLEIGIPTYSAHNQFLTSLGQSGLLGLVSIVAYLAYTP